MQFSCPASGPPRLGNTVTHRRTLLLAAMLAFTRLSSPVAAEGRGENQRLTVLVWGDPTDGGLLTHVRGQTVDLSVDLVENHEHLTELQGARQVTVAQGLSHTHSADAVVWLSGPEVFIFMATPAPGRLLVRNVVPTGGASSWSGREEALPARTAVQLGTLEAAALIVRSTLKSVLQGIVVGEPPSEAPAEPPVAAPPPTAAPTDEGHQLYWFLLGDWRTSWDGHTPHRATGIGAHVGAGWGRFTGGLTFMETFDRRVGPNEQPFWRQNAGLFVGLDLVQRARARLTIEGQSGVAIYNIYRFVDETLSRRPHFFVASELRASIYAKATGRLRLPIWVAIGADYVPGSPPLRFVPTGELYRETRELQPRFMLGLGAELW